jgi:CSLREA domain-containing protein
MLRNYLAAKSAARGKSVYSSPNASRSSVFRSSYRSYLEPLEARHLLSATVIQVTTTQDIVDPNDDFTSLREAVLAANASPEDNEIVLPAGTYTLTRQGANEDAGLTGDLDINSNGSLKITGAGRDTTTIDASGLYDADLGYGDRIFDVLAGASVEIGDVALTGGNVANSYSTSLSGDGGAIRNAGDLSISNSAFFQNSAMIGGAVSNLTGAEISVVASIFSHNSANNGGAISSGGAGSVRDSTISQNEARAGGGLYLRGAFEVVDTNVTENTSVSYGGGLFVEPLTGVTISGSSITGNSADVGAGINLRSGPLNISNSELNDNKAQSDGGGLYIQYGQAILTGSSLSGNSASRGGAIFDSSAVSDLDLSPSLIIHNCELTGNNAAEGGAIRNSGIMRVENSTLSGNVAIGYGGAIQSDGVVTVVDSQILNNVADAGGGVFSQTDAGMFRILPFEFPFELIRTTVSGNTATGEIPVGGGGIVNIGTMLVDECSISDNHSQGYGGGIQNYFSALVVGSLLQVLSSSFTGNTARYGGAVDAYAPTLIVESGFAGNSAQYGGALNVHGPITELDVTSSSFEENSAAEYGGAIWLESVIPSVISSSTFTANSAQNGGAIAGQGGQILASTFAGNSATNAGGAIYAQYPEPLSVIDSTFSANSASNGGGIAVAPKGKLLLSNSTVVLNRADAAAAGGGIALLDQATATLDNSIVAGNLAGPSGDEASSDIALLGGSLDPTSGYNLVGDPNSAGGLTNGASGNIVGDGLGGVLDLNTVLDPTLADNGGPTLTHALLANGPAVNAGDPNFDPNSTFPPTLFDQRGAGFARVTGGRIDIGAFELGSEYTNLVAGRYIFYNDSGYDFAFDQEAIDPTKQALLPNGTLAGPANVTSYSRGINGIMVDVAGSHPDITADDFLFRVGATNDPANWAVAPAPAAIQVLPRQGVGGSDRVVITWPDGAIKNTYLQVILAADEHTGLAEPDVFFFGNRVGDTFAATPPGAFVTNISDELATRFAAQTGLDDVSNALDFDKNHQININDGLIARGNPGFLPRIKIGPSSVDAVAVASQQAADASSVSSGNETQLESGGNAIAFALAQADLSRADLATPAATPLVESKLRAEPRDIPQAQIVDRVLSSGQSPVGGMATASELAVPADLLSDLDDLLDSLLN